MGVRHQVLRIPASAYVAVSILCGTAGAQDREERFAARIFAETGVRGGFVVHLGSGDGRLTAALRAGDGYRVHGLDRRSEQVDAARRRLRESGLQGTVSVDRLRGSRLPYVDGMVNLIVADGLQGVDATELTRVLTPNGVAYVRDGETWKKTVKPRPSTIDDWTHYLHDAGGNAVAHDSVVGPPRHLQWIGSPRWSRHHDRMASMSALVSAGGRIFYVMDEGSRVSIQLPPKWMLIARDAYNGTVLWKREIPSWHSHLWPLKSGPTQLARRLVAVGDTVYVTLGFRAPLTALDAATGETLRTYEGSAATEEVICTGDTIFVLSNKGQSELASFRPVHNVGDQRRVANEFVWNGKPREVMAFSAKTAKLLWKRESRVSPLTLTSDGERLFYHDGTSVVCHAAKTGEPLWTSGKLGRRASFTMNFGPRIVVHGDLLLFAGGDRWMRAFTARDGKELWKAPHAKSGYQSPEDLLVVGDLVWSAPTTSTRDSGVYTGRDVRTGEVKVEFPPDVQTYWFHHRCYSAKATDRFLLPSRTGIEFVDVEKKSWQIHHWVRGGCLYGIMPSNGLVYAPPHDCACYPEAKLFGFNALAAAEARASVVTVDDEERLEKGPAFGEAVSSSPGPHDWPTYRHDRARSGFTRAPVSRKLRLSWSVKAAGLSGRLTSPVAAEGLVLVAAVDTHTLHALDQERGVERWRFTVGGRIDSPPTVSKGRVYFGSRDGSVYCLRARDGMLIWRFLAARADLRVMAFEDLESVWPVSGSVLVENGVVFLVAGRSNFLDGGLRFLKLDALTGRKLGEKVIDEKDPRTGENVQTKLQVLNMTAGLPDVLSSDGKWLYMRSQRFDYDGERLEHEPRSGKPAEQGSAQSGAGRHLFAPMGFLDDSWFHRAYWVYGRSFAGGHAGYYQAGKFAPSGRLLVFDDDKVYGYGRKPEYYRWTTTLEHQLFSTTRAPVELPKGNRRGSTTSMVSFEKSPILDPTGKAVSVEAWVKPGKPNGVILAHGGPAQGYALLLKGRKPSFLLRSEGNLYSVTAKRTLALGQWAHLVGIAKEDGKLRVYANGGLVAEGKAKSLITSDPAQTLQIGVDAVTGVGNYKSPHGFTGTIDEVRVYHGELSEDEIRERVTDLGRASARSATLVLECAFDDGDGKDGSGNRNHGEVSGTRDTKGKIGNGLRFAGKASRSGGSFIKHDWTADMPVYVRAIVLAGDHLFVAGPADLIDDESSFQKLVEGDEKVLAHLARQDRVLAGKEGSKLWVVSAKTGEKVADYSLTGLPVWDGMAIAGERVFMAMTGGVLTCFESVKD